MKTKVVLLKFALLLSCFLVLFGCSYFSKDGYVDSLLLRSERQEITVAGEEISFYAARGQRRGETDTAVFYFTGTGCHSLAYPFARVLGELSNSADIFAIQKAGVNALSSGTDCSEQYLEREPLSMQIQRSEKLILFVLQQNQYENVVLYGSSEGNLLAGLLSERVPEVTHVVAQVFDISTPSRAVFERLYQNAGAGDVWAPIAAQIDDPSVPGDTLVTNRMLRTWRELVSVPAISDILVQRRVPVLLILAENDTKIPVESYLAACRRFTNSNLEDRLSVRLIAGAEHGSLESSDLVQMQIANWIKGRLPEASAGIINADCFGQ